MAGTAERAGAVAVVVPAYQAEATIADVIARTRAAVPGAALYVVDDGSRDHTQAAATGAGACVLGHARNQGKGAALASGIRRALADGADVVVTLDADRQHPPEDIPRLVAPVRGGEADLVLGARARAGTMPWGRRGTNWLSATLASRLTREVVEDAQSGFRAFTRAVATAVQPGERRYDYETAFLLGALAAGFRVRSVPIPTIYDGAASHFRPWSDTWRLARVFLRYRRAILRGHS
ncbi:MAG: glycosyltransferase family 2 protein [Gemmatimonadales bacterium]